MFFPDSNEANNVWTAAKGVIEKFDFRWVFRDFK
jgi:hypothetical protein